MPTKSQSLPSHDNPFLEPQPSPSLSSTSPYPILKHRHAYGPRNPVGIEFPAEGRTKQSFKDECDINVIMARYQATGLLEHVRDALPQFLDVTEMPDYQSAMDTVAQAKSLFASLPSAIRDRFDNDPRKLLEFVHDPKNLDESITLGFIDKARLKAADKPEGIPEAPLTKSSAQPEPQPTKAA